MWKWVLPRPVLEEEVIRVVDPQILSKPLNRKAARAGVLDECLLNCHPQVSSKPSKPIVGAIFGVEGAWLGKPVTALIFSIPQGGEPNVQFILYL